MKTFLDFLQTITLQGLVALAFLFWFACVGTYMLGRYHERRKWVSHADEPDTGLHLIWVGDNAYAVTTEVGGKPINNPTVTQSVMHVGGHGLQPVGLKGWDAFAEHHRDRKASADEHDARVMGMLDTELAAGNGLYEDGPLPGTPEHKAMVESHVDQNLKWPMMKRFLKPQ